MAEETSRIQVEVDGSRAVGDINRISAAFRRLEGSVGRVKAQFAGLGSATSNAFSRMKSGGGIAFRALGSGFRAVRRSMQLFANTFKALLKVFIAAGAAFTLFARSVLDTGNKINKFVNTLVILKGSTASAITELQLLFELSNKLGTSFTAAAAPFVKFAAAAAGALTDSAIRDVFESFATVGVALQLTQSEVTGVFLALQQIASKGVVSMEELRLQLAERVPGAMRLAAQSMDMSMKDFERAVQLRTINAGDFLEKFAKKLKDVYGDAALIASERLFADIQRLGNAFTAFKTEIFQAGFEDGLRDLVRSAAAFLENNPELSNALGKFSKEIFTRVADFLNSLSADRVISVLNTLIGVFETLVNVINTLAFEIRKLFNDDFSSAIDTVSTQTNNLEALVRERQELRRTALEGVVLEGFGSDISQFTPVTANDMQIKNAEMRLVGLDEKITLARDLLIAARLKAEEFGVTLAALPENVFDRLDTFVGVAPITLPKIEPLPDQRGSKGLTIDDTAPMSPQMTGDLQDALQTAERIATMGMPEFYDKLISGEIRNAMTDLAATTHDLNVLNDSQALLLQKIAERHAEVETMRNLPQELIESAKLNDLTRDLTALTEEYLVAEKKRYELKQEQLKLMEEEERRLASLTSFQKSLEESFISVQDVAINMAKKTEDAIVDMVTTGKASFSELAESIIADLTRMAIQAFLTRYVIGPLLGYAAQSFGDALGGTFSTTQTSGNAVGTPSGLRSSGGRGHSGGVVGRSNLSERSGFSKLRNGERSIIVEKGEGIFTQDQMKALAPISRLGSISRSVNTQPTLPVINVQPSGIKVEVINNTSEEANVETTRSPDGTELTRIIIGTVSSNLAKDGDLSKLLQGKFGLRNKTGLR